jgi:hypothetical protein
MKGNTGHQEVELPNGNRSGTAAANGDKKQAAGSGRFGDNANSRYDVGMDPSVLLNYVREIVPYATFGGCRMPFDLWWRGAYQANLPESQPFAHLRHESMLAAA